MSAIVALCDVKRQRTVSMIYINDREYDYPEAKSLSELFLSFDITADKGVAVAVNSKVIQRSLWPHHLINDNDRIIIIKATQGG